MRYLSANYVFPVSSPPLRNGIVCVNNDGYIVDVIDTGGKLDEREKLEFYNGILIPGFVNAHCHLELSHLHDVMKSNGGLQDFVLSIGKLRRTSDETILAAAKAADNSMWKNGTVAVGDISNNACTLSVKRESRMWYQTFVEVFGLDNSRSDEIMAAAKQVEQEYRHTGMSASIVPHAVYSVSRTLWKSLSGWYESETPQVISIHHQESNDELNMFHEVKGELTDAFRKDMMRHCLHRSSRCLLVHNTFSSKNDLSEYVSDPEKFYFVLCPGSNLFIQDRLPDFQLFASPDYHKNTCIGTDSLASNTDLSILDEMKIIQQHAPEMKLEMLLRWATLNGAKALMLDHMLGSFEKDKAPGVNLITGIDFHRMLLTADSAVKVLV